MAFTCIGDSWPRYESSFRAPDAHHMPRGKPRYHNAYAGPFCKEHRLIYQQKAIAHFKEAEAKT